MYPQIIHDEIMPEQFAEKLNETNANMIVRFSYESSVDEFGLKPASENYEECIKAIELSTKTIVKGLENHSKNNRDIITAIVRHDPIFRDMDNIESKLYFMTQIHDNVYTTQRWREFHPAEMGSEVLCFDKNNTIHYSLPENYSPFAPQIYLRSTFEILVMKGYHDELGELIHTLNIGTSFISRNINHNERARPSGYTLFFSENGRNYYSEIIRNEITRSYEFAFLRNIDAKQIITNPDYKHESYKNIISKIPREISNSMHTYNN